MRERDSCVQVQAADLVNRPLGAGTNDVAGNEIEAHLLTLPRIGLGTIKPRGARRGSIDEPFGARALHQSAVRIGRARIRSPFAAPTPNRNPPRAAPPRCRPRPTLPNTSTSWERPRNRLPRSTPAQSATARSTRFSMARARVRTSGIADSGASRSTDGQLEGRPRCRRLAAQRSRRLAKSDVVTNRHPYAPYRRIVHDEGVAMPPPCDRARPRQVEKLSGNRR